MPASPTVGEGPTPRTEGRPRALSLPTRLTAIAALLVVAAVLVVAGVAARLMRDSLSDALDRRLETTAKSFREGPASRVTTVAGLADEARRWLAVQPNSEDEVVALRTEAGEVLATTGGLDLSDVPRAGDLLGSDESRWWDVDGKGSGVRALTVPLVLGERPAGTLVAAASRRGVEATVDDLLSAVAWASGAGLVFAVALAFLSVRRTLRPLTDMAAEIDAIRPNGELPAAVSVQTPDDEVGRVAAAFDRLLLRIDEAIASQRRFISDASHELRTPLTVARGHLELVGDLDDPEAARSIRIALEELDRIGAVVEELLLLARLDEGLSLARERVEVDLVLREAALRGMLLGHGEVKVEDPPAGTVALGDSDRLLQVVSNLVGNALKHGGPGVEVTLAARPDNGWVALEVSDTGPGIAPDDVPHLFDRFYRGSAARRGVPGAGLGLAIVASLAEAMDGAVTVRSVPGEGTTFSVRLPAAR